MKNLNTFSKSLALMAFWLFFGFVQKTEACIDPDTVITVRCNYSADFTNIEIRLGNLKLHTETPNTFCSCALSSYFNAFTSPTYIAFVYEGTNTPYPNFNAWDNTTGANNAWNTEFPGYPNWAGYISEVINQGLDTDDKVEMVIRANTPPGTFAIVQELDSAMASITLGTDMWLPNEQTMAFDHPGLRNIRYDNSSFIYTVKPDAYFEDLDTQILSSDYSTQGLAFDLAISPNPVASWLTVTYELVVAGQVEMRVLDLNGQVMGSSVFAGKQPAGQHIRSFDLSAILPKTGIYLLEMKVGEVRRATRFFKTT